MNYTNQQYQIAVTQLFGFGPKRSRQLIGAVDNLSSIFHLPYKELEQITNVSASVLRKMDRKRALENAVEISKNLQRFEIRTLFYTDSEYPRRLKQCDDAPLVLYAKGNIEFNSSRIVSVVGTRGVSPYGKRICEELIEQFQGTSIQVVSGLAYGVDIAIHRACLRQGVPTMAVLAHGLEMVYPRIHSPVVQRMCEAGGVISEFPPFTNPDRENFPMRNRIVAGLSDATIVVESKDRGGSLITADLANDYNRDVFAFPGGVYETNSEGCNNLISTNRAHLIKGGNDFLQKMGWDVQEKNPVQRSMFVELTDEEQQVVKILESVGEQHVDALAVRTTMPISKLNVILFQLEMNGLIRALPGNRCCLL